MHMIGLPADVYVHHVSGAHVGQKMVLGAWDWNYGVWKATMCVLGIKPRSNNRS